jgi:hypothetical protein
MEKSELHKVKEYLLSKDNISVSLEHDESKHNKSGKLKYLCASAVFTSPGYEKKETLFYIEKGNVTSINPVGHFSQLKLEDTEFDILYSNDIKELCDLFQSKTDIF